ncbi:hypothetical protein BGX21_003128 [Mortierella sp. AD011]|nr:hypothetical protein BGX20_006370 [Mortierella sp. AD010]KAF9377673.1 hypothetical protein BGX21_003128 [Mortierella sp. AD011]
MRFSTNILSPFGSKVRAGHLVLLLTVVATSVMADVSCTMCEMTVGWLKHRMESHKSKEATKATLEKVCKLIPNYGEECANYVEEYGDQVINLINADVSSDEVCTIIGYCDI